MRYKTIQGTDLFFFLAVHIILFSLLNGAEKVLRIERR